MVRNGGEEEQYVPVSVVEVVKKQRLISLAEEKMPLWIEEKNMVLHLIDMNFISTLKGIVRQRVLRTSGDREF